MARSPLSPLTEVVVGGAQVAVTLLGAPLLRRYYNRYGATPEERTRPIPGDERVPHPKLGYTRAIPIDAPPTAVWPWLVQFGQGRAGFYSFDTLENMVGCDIHSVDRILPECQTLGVGDMLRASPKDFPAWQVVDLQAPRYLVLVGIDPRTMQAPPAVRGEPPEGYVVSTWQWLLEPEENDTATRLIVRQRPTYGPDQTLLWHLVEPFNFVMERQMLKGIKARAEDHLPA